MSTPFGGVLFFGGHDGVLFWAGRLVRGRAQSTLTPPPAFRSMARVPPIMPARDCMMRKPMPFDFAELVSETPRRCR